MSTALCWFRRDLRLDDNPAWSAATAHDRVLPVFVLEPELLAAAGPHRRRQLLANVAALADEIAEAGGRLHVVAGPAVDALPGLVADIGADAIHANRDVSPFATARDAAAAEALERPITWHWGTLTQPPGAVQTQKGTLSKVFTPFYNRWSDVPVEPVPAIGAASFATHSGGIAIPAPDAPPPLAPGTTGAYERLNAFLDVVDEYPDLRDLPAIDGTSQLSADLKFGTLGPRQVLDAVGSGSSGREAFIRQLAWRDWYAHLLYESPRIVDEAVREDYDKVRWLDDPAGLEAWQQGRTGYPIVDAGMRQLAATGWMHNRVRMIVASFLVKDLLIDWRAGERWFRKLLADADVSQNVGNWQWAAGTGTDAAPYFRIFNPMSQSKKFDPDGAYIRRWVPELAGLDRKVIHEPWTAGPLDLAAAGVILGDDYPEPIVEHKAARERTLAAYKKALA